MSVSTWKREKNKQNAQKSTGPRTEEGKRRSRENALRHGLATKVVTPAWEENAETETQRGAWVETFQPRNPIAAMIADRAFRSHRLYMRTFDAIDTAYIERCERAENALRGQWSSTVSEALADFPYDAKRGIALLMKNTLGCDALRDKINEDLRRLDQDRWEIDLHQRIKAYQEIPGAAPDHVRRALDTILEHHEFQRLGLSSSLSDDGWNDQAYKSARETVVQDLMKVLDGLKSYREVIAEYEASQIARIRDAEKLDMSDQGRLHDRYLNSNGRAADRDLKTALARCKVDLSQAIDEDESATDDASAPNEPTANLVDCAGDAPEAAVGDFDHAPAPNEPTASLIGRIDDSAEAVTLGSDHASAPNEPTANFVGRDGSRAVPKSPARTRAERASAPLARTA